MTLNLQFREYDRRKRVLLLLKLLAIANHRARSVATNRIETSKSIPSRLTEAEIIQGSCKVIRMEEEQSG